VGLLTLEAIGSNGEELALEAGKVTDIPVGWDEEFNCATFDSDAFDDGELQGVILDALSGLDGDWAEHLRVAE
jgi:hypothetical protein